MAVDIVETIKSFNAGRDPERLAMKYLKLRTSPFLFLRGTCHLFYARLPKEKVLATGPAAWISGDLHFENFGTYKGANRLVYFDINDFDEAVLAPVTWELVRLLAAILVARDALHVKAAGAARLCESVIDAYAQALVAGKAGWVDRDTADGPVQQLLQTLKERKRSQFLEHRTTRKGRKRSILCDGSHALEATPDQALRATALVAGYASRVDRPEFFKVLDVARRIAGTGSLGVERYVVLVEGRGSPAGNYLLDLKLAPRSSLQARVKIAQPGWKSHAHRVVALQQRLQAIAPAFLCPVVAGKSSYVLRELQPTDDRVALEAGNIPAGEIESVLRQMGQLAAWAQLRSSGRQGSAVADDLIAFGAARDKWGKRLMRAAHLCAERVAADWRTYCTAYDKGAFAKTV
jgi:uncharacterized protein (DUF2252 family)